MEIRCNSERFPGPSLWIPTPSLETPTDLGMEFGAEEFWKGREREPNRDLMPQSPSSKSAISSGGMAVVILGELQPPNGGWQHFSSWSLAALKALEQGALKEE